MANDKEPNLEENAEVPGNYQCEHHKTETQDALIEGRTVMIRYCRLCGETVK